MILGLETFADFLDTKIAIKNKYDIYLSNAIMSELDIENTTSDTPSINNYNKEMTNSVVVSAKFNDNLDYAEDGNSVYPVKYLCIQRKKSTDDEWEIYKTIEYNYAGKVIEILDSYVENNVEYQYRAIPILYDVSTGEYLNGNVSKQVSVKTVNDGNYLFDSKGTRYELMYDFELGQIKNNRKVTYVETLSSKYPYTFIGSNSCYDKGSIKCTLVLSEESKYGNVNVGMEHILREELLKWIANGDYKILRTYDGTFKLISIDDGITVTPNKNIIGLCELSFNYTEIGDATSISSLRECGMLQDDGGE